MPTYTDIPISEGSTFVNSAAPRKVGRPPCTTSAYLHFIIYFVENRRSPLFNSYFSCQLLDKGGYHLYAGPGRKPRLLKHLEEFVRAIDPEDPHSLERKLQDYNQTTIKPHFNCRQNYLGLFSVFLYNLSI